MPEDQGQLEPTASGSLIQVQGSSDGVTHPPKKRARKSREDGSSTEGARTVAKDKGKERGTAGCLSELMNMPLDVFFEVAARQHPRDVLNLSRTSKWFRTLLLAKNSRTVWIASLATLDALPPCPADMSEPSYASLLFDRFCFLCGSVDAKWIDYAIRLRLCKACSKSNILKGSEIVEEQHAEMLTLFPCVTGPDYWTAAYFVFPLSRTPKNKYYATHVIATLNDILAVHRQDREAAGHLLKEHLDDATAKHKMAVRILVWLKQERIKKELSDHDAKSARKANITLRLEELGYTKEDLPDDNEDWDKLVNQRKLVTDRMWTKLLPKLEEQLAIEKERRAAKAFADRVASRLHVIVKWYEDYVKEHLTDAERGLMPNRYDARKLPSLLALAQADDAQGPVSREAFVALTEELLANADAYKTRAKRELADILRVNAGCKDLQDLPADELLQRFCGFFQCSGCNATVDGCPYLTFEQLHEHWRETHSGNPWTLHRSNDRLLLGVHVPRLWPDSVPAVGRRVLEAVGIALNTPREVLDGWVREGRLFCECEHPGMPLPHEMSWAQLLFHLHQVADYRKRESEMMNFFGSRQNAGYVLRSSHSLLAGNCCCIKFLPEGADTAVASVRTTVDDALRAQIQAKLATRPHPGAVAVCRICEGLTRKTPTHTRLPYIELVERPEEIVWHLRRCHGREFRERDIVFVG